MKPSGEGKNVVHSVRECYFSQVTNHTIPQCRNSLAFDGLNSVWYSDVWSDPWFLKFPLWFSSTFKLTLKIVRFKLQFVPSTDDDSEDCFIAPKGLFVFAILTDMPPKTDVCSSVQICQFLSIFVNFVVNFCLILIKNDHILSHPDTKIFWVFMPNQ